MKTLLLATPGAKAIIKAMANGETVADQITIITGTSSATPGTRTAHAHGLAYTPSIVVVQAVSADDDVDNAYAVTLVKFDGTNITIKAAAASVAFKAYIM